MPGCLAFIILAVLGFIAVAVLGTVFTISDAIKWVLFGGWLQTLKSSSLYTSLLLWGGGLFFGSAILYKLYELATEAKPASKKEGGRVRVRPAEQKAKWGELDKPGNEQKQLDYWRWLNEPNESQTKEAYLEWLRQPENSWRLKGYERWAQTEGEQEHG